MARASYLGSARAMALGTPLLAFFCAATWPVLSPPLTLGRAEEETEFEALSREVNHHLVDLARTFRFAPYAGEVVLFRTDAQIPEADNRMFGWSGILAEDTPIYRLKGWHEDALLWSGHERIAQVIDSKIARIERVVSAVKTAVARVD